MKILCICEHGNVRSVALAYLIKTIYTHEAISIGSKNTSESTMFILYEWADKIIFLDKNLFNKYTKLEKKVYNMQLLDVGEDIWHDPYHPNLIHKILKQINSLGLS